MHKNILQLKSQYEKSKIEIDKLHEILLKIEEEVGPLDNIPVREMAANMKLRVANRILKLIETQC